MRIPVVALIPVERSFITHAEHTQIASAAERLVTGVRLHGASVDDLRILGVELSDDVSAWTDVRDHYEPGPLDRDIFIRLEVEVDFNLAVFDGVDSMPPEMRVPYAEIHAASLLRKLTGDLATVGNLSDPGLISFHRGIVVVGTRVTPLPRFSGILFGMAAHHASSRAWPSFVEVHFEQAYQWFKRLPGVRAGAPSGPVGRALCAISHLLTDYSRLNLVWAVLALEALYCTDNQNLASQLVERSGAFLGRPSTFQKQVSQMYNFRSRLVHGSMDFPLDYYLEAREFAEEEYEKSGQDSELVAISVLVATLQRLARADGTALSFTTQVAVLPADEMGAA